MSFREAERRELSQNYAHKTSSEGFLATIVARNDISQLFIITYNFTTTHFLYYRNAHGVL